MESIELIGYPIKVSNSTVFKQCFITFVTQIGVIEVKINCILENYKYARYIDYCHLCQIFIVKTRTNWILKDFITSEKIFAPKDYEQCLKLADIVRLCNKNFKKIDDNFLPLVNLITQDFKANVPITDIQKRITDQVL